MSEKSLRPYRESRQTVEWARPKHERRLFARAIFIIGCCPWRRARFRVARVPAGQPTALRSPRKTLGGFWRSISNYFSIGQPKHRTYPLLSVISKARSPSLVLASCRRTRAFLARNSV